MNSYTRYRDSGVEWLGNIPFGWTLKRMKYESIINRMALNDKTEPDYEIEYIDIGNVTLGRIVNPPEQLTFEKAPSRARRVVKRGDTIVSTVRTYLKAITYIDIEKPNLIASTGFAVISPGINLDSKFFSYLMMSNKIVDAVCSLSRGVSYPAVTSTDVANLMIWYPSLPEQKQIAKYLDHKTAKIDTLIEKKKRLIELLKEERTAVINQAVTKGLDPNVPMKDSGIDWLGEIPAHWQVKRLKYVISERLMYGANQSAEFEDRLSPRYIRITDFDDSGKLRDDTFKSLPLEIAKEYLLENGDILFARSGATVGKTFQFIHYDGQACFAGYLIKAKPDKSQILSDFLYLVTKSNSYENWKNSIFIQATIQNIGAEKYSNFILALPSLEEQLRIVQHIHDERDRIDSIIFKSEKEIGLLEEYRTALISQVVTGKIDVRGEKI